MDSSPDSLKESDVLSDEQNTDTLNWSISNITAASDLKPDILDSHIWCTPAGLDSAKDKPLSFVKLSFEEAGDDDETEVGQTSNRFSSLIEKDKKFEKMLSAMKNLEEFHQMKSKSPRKLSSTSSDYGSGRTSDRSLTVLHTSSSSNNSTITPFPPRKAASPTERNSILKEERKLEDEIHELKESNESLILRMSRMDILLQEKDSFIRKLEEQCRDIGSKWSNESNILNKKLSMAEGEIKSLKTENAELEKKISAYEMELEKALSLASDFKGKIEEDEAHRDKIVEEFITERTLNSQQLAEERKRIIELTKEKNSLLHEIKSKHSLFKKELTDSQTRFEDEKSEYSTKLRKLEGDNLKLKEEISKAEGHIHEFYQKQMESILSEKLMQLRSYIEELEKSMREENNKIINDIRHEHKSQISAIKEKYTKELRKLMGGFDSERLSFRSTLEAARLEADALRDQIRLRACQESSSLSQNNYIDDTSLSSAHQTTSSSRALLQKVQNNLPNVETTNDVLSSSRSSPILNNIRNSSKSQSFHEDDLSILTESEKEDIVKGYIQKYINENPEALSDTSLMAKLNDLLYNLVSKKSNKAHSLS